MHRLVCVVGSIRAGLTTESLTVHEGETATLICRTWGKPVDEVRWFKDRRPLVMTGRIGSLSFR